MLRCVSLVVVDCWLLVVACLSCVVFRFMSIDICCLMVVCRCLYFIG